RGSWPHRVLRDWIAQGANRQAGSGRVTNLRVLPEERALRGPGETANLKVVAEYADGTQADVTRFADFRARDDSVAAVSPLGRVRGLRPGDTPIVVSYRGNLAAARVLVPLTADGG